MAEINLGQILKEEGYAIQSFVPNFENVPAKDHKPNGHKLENHKKRLMEGKMAHASYYAPNKIATDLEYFLPVMLEYADGVEKAENGEERPKTKTIELPFPVLSITGKKRLVETYLTQRNGTMKELISSDGYEINIRGYMIGAGGEFPENDMITLRQLYEMNEPIAIHNVVTDIFLYRPKPFSDKVVITELSFPEARGNKHVREYEMKLVNDAPFNLSDIK